MLDGHVVDLLGDRVVGLELREAQVKTNAFSKCVLGSLTSRTLRPLRDEDGGDVGQGLQNEEVPVDTQDSSFDDADDAELKLVLHVLGTERCIAEVVRQRPKSDVGA